MEFYFIVSVGTCARHNAAKKLHGCGNAPLLETQFFVIYCLAVTPREFVFLLK